LIGINNVNILDSEPNYNKRLISEMLHQETRQCLATSLLYRENKRRKSKRNHFTPNILIIYSSIFNNWI